MKDEIWKDIEGFEGYYQVSNKGRVRSLDRLVPQFRKTGEVHWGDHKGMVLKGGISDRGYRSVSLRMEGTVKQARVHRLVARAFVPNPNMNKEVNHRDCDKLNNCAENLEWCTRAHNVRHAIKNGRGGGRPTKNRRT